jgi:hypothetical protein
MAPHRCALREPALKVDDHRVDAMRYAMMQLLRCGGRFEESGIVSWLSCRQQVMAITPA